MKKYFLIVFIFVCIISISSGATAYANSAAPIRAEDGRGIIFEKHDKVKILSETLDVDFSDLLYAKVTAKYQMKNITDESISVKNMFLYPIGGMVSKEVKISRNDTELAYDVEYFGNNMNDIDFNDDWEKILSKNAYNNTPLGDGSGFVEYTVKNNNNDITIEFIPEDYYFTDYFRCQRGNGVDTLSLSKYTSEARLIFRQEIAFGGFEYSVSEIDDIYEYLQDYYDNKYEDRLMAQTAYKSILYGVEKNPDEVPWHQSLFGNVLSDDTFEHSNSYLVGALLYDVEFSPNEQLELTVEYNQGLGTNSAGYIRHFKYYLTPAKYWQDFGKIEINLRLNEDYPRLERSSLQFKKIDKLNYQYISDKLPNEELAVTVSKPKFSIFMQNAVYFLMYLWPFVIILLLIIILSVIILVIKKKKKKHTSK